MKAVSYGFSKTLLCPSSEELLSFIVAKPSPNERCNLTAHLAECSFCDAELRFLSKYPPPPVTYEPAVMPDHLRLLAHCLLSEVGITGFHNLTIKG
jgi:hypothetical protein